MKKTIFTILLALISIEMFAQQVMLADSITKNPVCYATVYDANGNVIGRSDMVGYIQDIFIFKKALNITFPILAMSPRVSFIMRIASFSYLHHLTNYQKSMLRQRKRSTIIVKCTLGA